jgi:hypothetical protein
VKVELLYWQECPSYHLPDGRVSPVPSREQIEEALA